LNSEQVGDWLTDDASEHVSNRSNGEEEGDLFQGCRHLHLKVKQNRTGQSAGQSERDETETENTGFEALSWIQTNLLYDSHGSCDFAATLKQVRGEGGDLLSDCSETNVHHFYETVADR
jgi:hypothetical protein